MFRWNFRIAPLLIAAFAAAGCVEENRLVIGPGDEGDEPREEESAFERSDLDGDGQIDPPEFMLAAGNGTVLGDYDANRNAFVDRREFNEATFNRFDVDGDVFIDEKEFDDGRDGFFGTDERFDDNFDDFDGDLDTRLDIEEFEPAVGRYVDTFDENGDGVADSDEFGRSMFDLFDRSGDGFVDDGEFNTWWEADTRVNDTGGTGPF